jgi:hypothetical protein
MNRLLVLCPTRERPKILERMLKSYLETKSSNTDLAIYLNADDPSLEEYRYVLEKNYSPYFKVGPRRYLAEAYNLFYSMFPEYDYYAPVNDDHVFITPGWDKKLIDIIETQGKGWGLAAAEDTLTNWNLYKHPSGCVISGNIPRTLGYMVWPKIHHIGIDDYYQRLMQGIDRLFHVPEVVIEHRHWLNGRALLDKNYKFVYGIEEQNYGRKAVEEYLKTQLEIDIAKLKEAMK